MYIWTIYWEKSDLCIKVAIVGRWWPLVEVTVHSIQVTKRVDLSSSNYIISAYECTANTVDYFVLLFSVTRGLFLESPGDFSGL